MLQLRHQRSCCTAAAPARPARLVSARGRSRPAAPPPPCRPQQRCSPRVTTPPRASAALVCSAGRLVGGSDVIRGYTETLTADLHELAELVRDFEPAKADEVLSEQEQQRIAAYIDRAVSLLLLEVDAEVQEFVQCLKDWPLKWLQDDGRVLTGLCAQPAGDYLQQEAVRFYLPDSTDSSDGDDSYSGSGEEWQDLPRHNLAVAFDTAPEKWELESDIWRLDKSVNTLTFKRALLALVALWHRMPLQQEIWLLRLLKSYASSGDSTFKRDVGSFYTSLDLRRSGGKMREHAGVFEGSALSGVIMAADEEFDWASLPAASGGMPDSAIERFRAILPAAGRPDPAAAAALLNKMEEEGQLGRTERVQLDLSQLQAIATAVINPLSLLHGPPGTGKTTTIGALLLFLRRQHGFKGRILATAQSNVAVDNILETCMRLGGLRVLRVGEPVKVRSCLQSLTLRVQEAAAVAADPGIMEARQEQQALVKRLRSSRRKGGEFLDRDERSEIFRRLDTLRAEIDAATRKIRRQLLDAADVVGVTCTGAAGPELQDFAFDIVVMDEGSQAAEPEALIPIMKGSQRLVLVGDHKQLPPVIKSKEAADEGLGLSLFERLLNLGAPTAMLQVQYRSHPTLMDFINQQFYHSLLSNGVSAAARPRPVGFPFPNASVPIVFINVDGRESSSARGSKRNEQAAVMEDCVMLLTETCGLFARQLGVITPYAAQAALLSKRLQRRGLSINGSARGTSWDSVDDELDRDDLEVKTVDGYQGREKDVILLSTVRSNSNQQVGFLADERRINVALSRARTALVVVGHVGTLRGSKTWSQFLKHVGALSCHLQLGELRALIPAQAASLQNKKGGPGGGGAKRGSGGGRSGGKKGGAGGGGKKGGGGGAGSKRR